MTPPSRHQQRDIALFDRIAADYGRKDLLPASRQARALRQRRTLRLVPDTATLHVLEIGCGAGFGADYLAGRCASYTGIDYSAQLIALAQARHAHTPRVTFAVANAKDFRPERPFDLAFLIGVLHHVDNMPAALAQARDLLAPGGWLVINEPQPGNPLVRLLRRLRKRADDHYSEDQRELAEAELRTLFTSAGFTDLRLRGQGFFSTPFAEVVMPCQPLARLASALACALDPWVEGLPQPLLRGLCWNLIAAGRKPSA
jgi:SAM-dependent methyltransferase